MGCQEQAWHGENKFVKVNGELTILNAELFRYEWTLAFDTVRTGILVIFVFVLFLQDFL